MNPHGYSIREHKEQKHRQHLCPFCLTTTFTQGTAILESAEGQSIVWLPKFCPPCTRRTLRTSGPLED